jgi:hypothetical protein
MGTRRQRAEVMGQELKAGAGVRAAIPTDLLMRFLQATPEQWALFERLQQATPKQLAAVERILSGAGGELVRCGGQGSENGKTGDAGEALAVLARSEGKVGARRTGTAAGPAMEKVLALGRLRYRPGFEDVWVGDTHYDLRERSKARLCIQYLVENTAFDAKAARRLVDEIDPYVREKGDFPRLATIKIDDYFNDRAGKLQVLRRELIASVWGDGRYFLKVD